MQNHHLKQTTNFLVLKHEVSYGNFQYLCLRCKVVCVCVDSYAVSARINLKRPIMGTQRINIIRKHNLFWTLNR